MNTRSIIIKKTTLIMLAAASIPFIVFADEGSAHTHGGNNIATGDIGSTSGTDQSAVTDAAYTSSETADKPISADDYTPGPFDYGAEISNFDKKKIVEVRRIYNDTGFGQLINIQEANNRLAVMQRELDTVTSEFNDLANKKVDVDERYTALTQTMYQIIANIAQLNSSIKQRLANLQNYTEKLYELRKALSHTAKEIDTTNEVLAKYIQVLYALNNEIYDSENIIDDTRLLIMSDNIADTTSQATTVQALTFQIMQLNTQLREKKTRYESTTRKLYHLKKQYKEEVEGYMNEMEYLKQQKVYLNDFYAYIQNDKTKLDGKYERYLKQKAALQKQVESLNGIVSADRETVQWSGNLDITPLLDHSDRPDSGTYFSRPVIPKGITATFKDKSYKDYFGLDHLAIDLRGAQGDPIFAPADGVVYKIVESGGTGLSWMFVLHPHGYITVYLHVTEFLVDEGDYVRRGQQIAKIGGTPGTIGAGYMTTGPHLHREVYKNGEVIDPMTVLDLSPIRSEKLVPSAYQAKYYRDKTILYNRIDNNEYIYQRVYDNFYQGKGAKSSIFYNLQQYSEKQGPYMFWLASALIMKESNFHLYTSKKVGFGRSCDDVYSDGPTSSNSKVRRYTTSHYAAFLKLDVVGEHLLCSYLGAVGPIQYLPKRFVAFLEDQNYDVSNFAEDKDDITFWYDIIIAKMKKEGLTDADIKDLLTQLNANNQDKKDLFDGIDREHKVIDFLERYNGGSYQGQETLTYAKIISKYLIAYSKGEKAKK